MMAARDTAGKENKMGTMAVNGLLIAMSVPMMISMLVQATYNVVNSLFVARLSEEALAAVSLAFPVQNLMISLAVGTGVGINALLSRSLGEKNFDKAHKVARNGLFLAFLSYLAVALLGLFLSHKFFVMQTDIPYIVQEGTAYMTICTVCSFGLFGEITLSRLLQSTGRTFYTMLTQGLGAMVNIILDPIFIFGWLGFPALGVKGAAIATVTAQTLAMCLALYFNLTRNPEVKLSRRGFRPEGWIIKQIYAVGVPSIIMASVGSVMVFFVNRILLGFSATAIAVFGVYFRLQSFILMPVFGLTNGMVPIVAYNYGAGNRRRIIKTIKLCMVYASSILLIGMAVFWLFPHYLLMMFDASENMMAMGVAALRIISLGYLFAGFCIVASTVFQALGNGVLSLIGSVVRQLVVLVPAAFILAHFLGVNGVWWAFPLADAAALLLCAFFLCRIYKQKIKPMVEKPHSEAGK